MTTEEVLTAYRRTLLEIDELERQLDQVTPSGGPSGIRGTRRSGPSTNHGLAAAMQLGDGLKELIRDRLQKLTDLEPQVRSLLSRINTGRELQIVQEFYLLGLADREIGVRMNLSESRVAQIRRKFVRRSAG